MDPKRIAILFHEGDRHIDTSCYAIHHFRQYWEEDGHSVVHLFGVKRYEPADIILVHVNLSVVPEEYIEFATRYPIALNAGIRDIRKSTFTQNRVLPGDEWDGPVIVKSDLNYAGVPELRMRRSWPERRWRTARRVRRALDRATGRSMPYAASVDYDVYDSMGEVPPAVFANPRLIVERFVPQVEGGLYQVTMYQFLGDRHTCSRFSSAHRVINASRSVTAAEVDPHPEIIEWRRRIGIDYGKLDYVVHDGEAVLLDVNKTTGMGTYYSDAQHHQIRRHRAEGIYSYFRS